MTDLKIATTSERTLAGLVVGKISPKEVHEEEWAGLIDLALDQGLGGMLLLSLRQAGWAQVGEASWQSLVDSARRSGRRSLLLERTRRQAAAAFDQAGIPALWLKGIALANTYYPEPHLRPMDDIDVLVSADQLAAARDALLGLGFQQEKTDFSELVGFAGHIRHHEDLLDRTGQVKIELHFRLLAPELHQRLDGGYLDWFWEQTKDLTQAGPSFRVFKPEANLLYLCAHLILQRHGASLNLLHLLDLHLLVENCTLDWEHVVDHAVALHWTHAVERALGLLPNLFGTQLPEGMLEELQERRPADESTPRVWEGPGNIRRWEEWSQLFGRISLYQRLHLVWRTLFPPEAFMRQRYHLPAGRSLLPYYLIHLLDGIREVGRALFKTDHRRIKPVKEAVSSKNLNTLNASGLVEYVTKEDEDVS